MAPWCPHCAPLSVTKGKALAHQLQIPLNILDIDVRDQEREADQWVEKYGDPDPDYLIPQVFLEYSDGSVRHLLTGVPGSVEATGKAWDRVLDSPEFRR